ncbi:MAG TPA: xanthine dehydrogenase family protein molybdopterin-binding subunit, partial [Dehalococcoidia bacterium]|nr:xanthine dehydrogenase family protein molybdopterin-binding subunit [Dehalococcoidia bacterium]
MAETRWVGANLKRKEDPSLLTGRGSYVDDLRLPGMLHAAFLASPHAHARIKSIDASEALKLPGVVAVLTGRDIARRILPAMASVGGPVMDFGMAVGKARYVGEPVAAVVATDRYIAEDARDLVRVDYEPLPAVVDGEVAMAPGAPLLYEAAGSNLLWHRAFAYGDPDGAFQQAEVIVKGRFHFHRYSSTPVETCGVVASYDPAKGSLTIWDNNQLPMIGAPFVALQLKLPPDKVRFIEGNIGGGYGNKAMLFAYDVLVGALAMAVGRPVNWMADRREELMAATVHCAGVVTEAELALSRDARILGMRIKSIQDFGHFIGWPEPVNILRPFYIAGTGCYKIANILMDVYAVVTNKLRTGPNRGYGLHQHYFVLERMVDKAAKELGLDPAEIRFRNFIQPQEMPYTIANGNIYDGGDYPETLHRALEMIGYQEFRKEQARLRQQGRHLGIGLSTIVETGFSNIAVPRGALPPETSVTPAVFGSEVASVRLEGSG